MTETNKKIPVEYVLNKPKKTITLAPPSEDISQEKITVIKNRSRHKR